MSITIIPRPVNDQSPATMTVTLPASRIVDHLDLQLRADGRHSVPTQIRVTGSDGSRLVSLGKPPLVAPNGIDCR